MSEGDAEASTANNQNENEFPITTIMVVVFILMICTVLLLLYFFYKYLIYVVIGLFAIASVSGTFECLSALISFVNCGKLHLELKRMLFSYNYHYLQKQKGVCSYLVVEVTYCNAFWFHLIEKTYVDFIPKYDLDISELSCLALKNMLK